MRAEEIDTNNIEKFKQFQKLFGEELALSAPSEIMEYIVFPALQWIKVSLEDYQDREPDDLGNLELLERLVQATGLLKRDWE